MPCSALRCVLPACIAVATLPKLAFLTALLPGIQQNDLYESGTIFDRHQLAPTMAHILWRVVRLGDMSELSLCRLVQNLALVPDCIERW